MKVIIKNRTLLGMQALPFRVANRKSGWSQYFAKPAAARSDVADQLIVRACGQHCALI